ncbi:hypothetical protein L7F22_059338 [Adiantum nelumboides]|nr:hypothetical protein [Adiantum nelumboides]
MADFKTQMEKLEKGNYQQPWKFWISNYLMGKGLWGLVVGDEPKPHAHIENLMENRQRAIREWEEWDCWVIFSLSQHISNSMTCHIQDLDTSLRVWECLECLYSTSTKARRIQIKNKLNNLMKSPIQNVNDFILKLKDISDALGFIGSIVDDIDLVGHTLNALRGDDKWKSFTTLVYVRDTLPDFEQLTTLMLMEELNHGVNRANKGQDQVFFAGRGRGRGNRGGNQGQPRACYYNDNHDNQTSHDHNQSSKGRGKG